MQNLIGQSVGRYHIIEQLGEGGMAAVFKAYDTHLERDVAVKILSPVDENEELFLKRFQREAKALGKLTHPSIVGIIDYGEYQGMPYLVMEYIPGGTLKLRMGKPIPYQTAARWLLPIAHALKFAHQNQIIHRDVKPANILVGENDQLMLSDFGIAKILNAEGTRLTATGVGVGTPEYMAPEQSGSEPVDHRADIYALMIVFYEMVTGRKPFHADTPMAVVLKQITDLPPAPRSLVPDLPEWVENVIKKGLEKRPENRFENMDALIAEFEKMAHLPEGKSSSKAAMPIETPPVDTGMIAPTEAWKVPAMETQALDPTAGEETWDSSAPAPTPLPGKVIFNEALFPAQGDGGSATPPSPPSTVQAPLPVKKKFPLAWIFAIIGVVAVCLIGAVVLLVSMVSSAAKRPILTDDVKLAQATGDLFMISLRDEKYDDAFKLCAKSLRSEVKDAEQLKKRFDDNALQPQEWSFSDNEAGGEQASLAGEVNYKDGRAGTVKLALVKQDGVWKISGFQLK